MKYLFLLLILFSASTLPAEETAIEKADQLAGAKKYDEALLILREYAVAHPLDIKTHEKIQRILEKKSGKEAVIQEYRSLYEKEPTAFHGILYGRLLESPGEREKLFRENIAKDPAYELSHVELAKALMDQDRLQEGIDAGKTGLAAVSEPVELHYMLARIYRRMKDYPHAAAEAREFLRVKPDEDTREFANAYEWMEVSNSKDRPEQLALAKAWLAKYNADVLKGEGMSGAMQIAELLFIFASNDQEPAKTRKYAEIALQQLSKEKPAESGEERDLYFRTKGALLAIQAWAEIKVGGSSRVPTLLQSAEKTGPASEMFYFSALAYKAMNNPKNALKNAIKAASYPPVYSMALPLAASLWKESGAPEAGLEDALHKQRVEFSGRRKERIVAQMVSEKKVEAFEFADPSNKKLSAQDLSGKITLINFWAVWCPPCREELPHWNAFVAKHGKEPQLQLLAVGDEPWETMLNYLRNHEFSFPVFRAEDYWDKFGIEGIPTLLVVDPAGKVRFRSSGFEEGMEYEETLLWQIEAVRKSAR